ncbi:MAG: hydantoinase B/oxoprolinase family protein [Nitrospinota bacterium]|nr:hydantoinase B/oxoprolinase family protein [Nitrospinota bacterium]
MPKARMAKKTPRPRVRRGRRARIDPVTLAVLSKRFDAVTTKMANTLFRTGRSGVLNVAKDFSTSIVTRDCELLTGAETLPIHVLSGADLMARAMMDIHPDLNRGDAFLHNSPYHGCSHPADHTILVPVIDEKGTHHFTVWVKAHQADCGNSKPTTYMGHARDVYEEGALIFPAVKVEEDYEEITDIVRMCEMRIRVPAQWRGDFLAMVGAARIGEREVLAMAEEYGWETLHAFAAEWFDYSEKVMVSAVRKLPSGEAAAVSVHDPVPGTPPEGIPIQVKVKVDSENALIDVDLTDNPDTMPCGLNLSEACARTAAMIAVFNSIEDEVPTNAGSFRRIRVHIREGCVAGGGKHPTSMSVATTNLADRVTNPVQRAFSMIQDGLGLAECGPFFPASMGVISGFDPRNDNAPFVNQIFMLDTGGAGAAKTDAWLTICHAGNSGLCFIDSVELDELHFPILVKTRRLVPDTEGAGRMTGAPAGLCEYGPVGGGKLEVAYIADGAVNNAKGTLGGGDGAKIRNYRRTPDGVIHELPACANIILAPDETVISYTAGGGGYGPPHERPPEKVEHDVEEGWITRERAREVYGVVFDEEGKIDSAATAELRKTLEQDEDGGS